MELTEKITFRASEKLKNRVANYADLQGISTGSLIRNWINIFLKNQIPNTLMQYQLDDGRLFSDMKALCEELNISSRTARKRVKNGVIKKITTNSYQTQKYGPELCTTNSGITERNRIQV